MSKGSVKVWASTIEINLYIVCTLCTLYTVHCTAYCIDNIVTRLIVNFIMNTVIAYLSRNTTLIWTIKLPHILLEPCLPDPLNMMSLFRPAVSVSVMRDSLGRRRRVVRVGQPATGMAGRLAGALCWWRENG